MHLEAEEEDMGAACKLYGDPLFWRPGTLLTLTCVLSEHGKQLLQESRRRHVD